MKKPKEIRYKRASEWKEVEELGLKGWKLFLIDHTPGFTTQEYANDKYWPVNHYPQVIYYLMK